ncbi:nudC domain-containing protein 3 isoform X2 [Cephus cinctus]|uniref:NudC domain-containing protein 3 isoform X2 n=1 Tax=Cephus cinctus TaxID=211228 RepID=A0AAJ7BZ91_CEPCN|nr:nudC domain-containing protein 3 isoform X2 [Cephus cinctus]
MVRITDFYVKAGPQEKVGFPPGVIEKLVLTTLCKWKEKHSFRKSEDDSVNLSTISPVLHIPPPAEEIEIGSDESPQKDHTPIQQPSDSYNGAVRENYSWSQSISDLDVLIKVPSAVKKAKDLRVDITTNEIKIETRKHFLEDTNNIDLASNVSKEWMILFRSELCFKTKKDESVWSLVPGEHITIHLEKCEERWWQALIIGEPNIELNKINCSRNLDELCCRDQMKVQELMWNHQQKLLGKPTSEQTKMEEIFKKAWNAEGSPFKGTEYDPSIVNFN